MRSWDPSSKGHTLCPWCFLEVWHTQQRASKSSRQKSLRTSPCATHTTSTNSSGSPDSRAPAKAPAAPILLSWSFRKVLATFFSARLTVGSFREHFFLHTGQSRRAFFLFQNCCRQIRQKLWLHFSTTGSWKISQQMGQDNSSSSMELECEETARGRVTDATLGLWKNKSFPG